MSDISVVLLQHNQSIMTRIALQSVRESDITPDEIILVDNGSAGHEIEWADHEPGLTVMRLGENTGFTIGMNAGWRAAKSEFIVMCNNDLALSKHCLRRLKLGMEADPSIGWLVGCYQDGAWQNSKTEFPPILSAKLSGNKGEDRGELNAWSESLGDTPILEYGRLFDAVVVMVRRSITLKVGPYWDELLNQLVHDYSLRLWAEGYKLASCHNAVYWHSFKSPTYLSAHGQGIWAKMDEVSIRLMDERWGREKWF